MSNGVVFVGREKEIEDFRSAVNSLEDGGRAMLVVGAVGYGKSTLLREFERRCNEDEKIFEKGEVIVIRDEFSRSDDPLSFLSRVQEAWLKEVNPKSMKIIGGVKKYRTYLEGAIDAIATGASLLSPAGALISSMKMGLPSMPKLPQNMGFLLQAFVADLAEFKKNNPDKRLVLLFDEYHKISNEDIFNAMFDDIIENLPKTKNILLVIASREKMVEASAEPLKLFEEYETASFFKENLAIDDKKLVTKAQKLLKGHPYSLGLLLRISKETNIEDVIEGLPETKVDDYLHKEFFDRLPENVQRFLRKVCVLQILDENICKFVISSDDFDETACHNILNQLQKLMVLDELGKVKTLRFYRLHDLFRDFLVLMNETSLPGLHLKAAEYYKNKIEKGREARGIEIMDVRFALYHLQESKDVNAFVEVLNDHLEGLHMLGYVIESLNYFNKINFEKISDAKIKSFALHNYAINLYCIGKYDEALDKYNQSLEIKKKLGDHSGISATLHQIAMIHETKGDYDEALDKYNQSLEISKKLGDQRRIAYTLIHIANIHERKGEFDKALDKYNQSLEIKRKLDDHRGIASSLLGIAIIHQNKGEYDEAVEKYNQSLEIYKNLGHQSGIASSLHQIANVHYLKREYDEALKKYNQSLKIMEKLGDQNGIAYTTAQMGLLYASAGNKKNAIEYTQKALEIFEKIGLENEVKKAKAQIEKIRK
ncbi:MAG: tetratricopeptide repeat protein [Candidatus Methanoperedens sp.]|nr:tetratricopeptide repeat protein [Candidatus Methanoperedens sp.]MCZ7395638.1 tetratricopeptide repeat protein [Candidatus Methanoperedens sp.]